MDRHVIFNADDFGASTGINRGIIECHTRGVLTSTSMMVTGRAVGEAVELSRQHPKLAIGLHFDVWGEDEREFDIGNHDAVRDEFRRQLDEFHNLMGRIPTHVDSHRHAHRQPGMLPVFQELVTPLGVALRDDGRIRFVGGFYAQWEWLVTELQYVSVPFLLKMLAEEVGPGWTEISCHPGYRSPDFQSVYLIEREAEVATLTDPQIKRFMNDAGLSLASFADYNAARAASREGAAPADA
jgi:chitin disaccharide deacetylase